MCAAWSFVLITPHTSRITLHASRLSRAPMSIPLALYLHIPFCAVRCAYCDFNTYAGLERLYEPYAAALIREIRRAGAERGRLAVRTIFIGGGTPTVLPPTLLADVLDVCREAFDVASDAEITSEANPGTVDQAHFAALAAHGRQPAEHGRAELRRRRTCLAGSHPQRHRG